jgi:hypothetical protein
MFLAALPSYPIPNNGKGLSSFALHSTSKGGRGFPNLRSPIHLNYLQGFIPSHLNYWIGISTSSILSHHNCWHGFLQLLLFYHFNHWQGFSQLLPSYSITTIGMGFFNFCCSIISTIVKVFSTSFPISLQPCGIGHFNLCCPIPPQPLVEAPLISDLLSISIIGEGFKGKVSRDE